MMLFRLRRLFSVFLEGNINISEIFRLRRIFLCVSLRKMFKFSGIFRLRRISLCVSLRKTSNCKNLPPPADFPLYFLKENVQFSKNFRLRRIFPLCFPIGKCPNFKRKSAAGGNFASDLVLVSEIPRLRQKFRLRPSACLWDLTPPAEIRLGPSACL